jgi:ribose transport system substrate-binding protein
VNRFVLVATATVVLVSGAGCGASQRESSSTAAGGVPDAVTAGLKRDFSGTSEKAPTGSVTVPAGLKIWVISCAQAAEGCSVPSAAMKEAGSSLNWDVTVFDGAFGAGGAYGNGVRQALAAKADAIVLMFVDCNLIQAPLREARTAGVPVIGVVSFDCDDSHTGGQSLFKASMQMNSAHADVADWVKEWGRAKARWIIDATKGKARVVSTVFDGKIIGDYANRGFTDELKSCGGCSIVDDVHIADSDISSGVMRQKFAAALTSHPDANATQSLFDAWMSFGGLGQAVNASGRAASIHAMGGEGLTPNLGLIRTKRGQNASVAYDASWLGWGAVDTTARALAGQPEAPEGIGWQTVDSSHNLPGGEGAYKASYDFRTAYKSIWKTS